MSSTPLTHDEFVARIWEIGEARYHHRHPFHALMHEGRLSRAQLQAWALNRYYYQSIIPIKDALILAKSDDAEFRRHWRKRILDHDGEPGTPGGIEKWIKLAEATGLSRELVESTRAIMPATRFAVNAYLDLVRNGSLIECVASSLTELFSPKLITLRVAALKEKYPWLAHGLVYFEARLTQAPADSDFALAWLRENARTRDEQEQALAAVTRKCDILWAQLDALHYGYVEPAHIPPGAFDPYLDAKPRLARGAKIRTLAATDEVMLLLPEAALKLKGSAAAILTRCDGVRSGAEIARELAAAHAGAPTVANDVREFLARLSERGAIQL